MSSGRPAGEPVDDPEDTAGPRREDLLDVGEEVARLAETLAGWWTSVTVDDPASRGSSRPAGTAGDRDTGARVDAAARPAQDGGPAHSHHESGTGESCRICPLCRVLDIARAARPDLLTQVATAAETVALLLREAAAGDRAREAEDTPTSASAELDEVAASGADPRPRGTPIIVRDVDEASSSAAEQQERGTPWD